jgi:hypothetical protein
LGKTLEHISIGNNFLNRNNSNSSAVKKKDWQIRQIFFFCGTGAWTQGLHLEPFHQPYFYEGFFEIGFRELFAWAGFEPRASWSLPPT